RITDVRALHHFEKNLQVRNRARHRTNDTRQSKWPGGLRVMTGRRNASRSWLQPANAAEMCGHADRSTTVAADATCGTPGRDRRSFSPAGSAGCPRQVPSIVRATVEQVIGFPCHQEFGSVGHAEHNCAGLSKAGHKWGVVFSDNA